MAPKRGKDWTSAAGGPNSSDVKWRNTLEDMVKVLQGQQSQIETLVRERKFLEDYLHLQHDRWVSMTRCLKSQISRMKEVEDMEKEVQNSKMEAFLDLKEREVMFFKKQYELSEIDLEDLRKFVGTLEQKVSEVNASGGNVGMKATEFSLEEKRNTSNLQEEIKKLKNAHKDFVSKKDSEISALVAEKDFIWNQFQKLDEDCTALHKSKCIEIEQAHEAIEKLQSIIQKLESSVTEKDDVIIKLKADIAGLQFELKRCSKENAVVNEKLEKLQIDMAELRASTDENEKITSKLRSQKAKIDVSNGKPRRRSPRNLRVSSTPLAGKHQQVSSENCFSCAQNGSDRVLRKRSCLFSGSRGSHASSITNVMKRCSKTKERSNAMPESPKLFSSTFKVPKLKDLSSQH